MKRIALLVLVCAATAFSTRVTAASINLLGSGTAPAAILVSEDASRCLQLTAADFQQDALEATAVQWPLVHTIKGEQRAVVILSTIADQNILTKIKHLEPSAYADLHGMFESFKIIPVLEPFPGVKEALLVVGSDDRGAMYGLYELSERVFGTDPMKFWTDFVPDHKDTVVWQQGTVAHGPPTVRYRGLFINDEDSLLAWHGDPEDYTIEPDIYAKIVETVCRLKGNLIAPAMIGNYMTPETRQLVHDRGLYYTASHLEVLLSNPSRYWKTYATEKWGKTFPYSYTTYPDNLRDFWRDSIDRNRKYRAIWPVGLKGDNDYSFWVSDPNAPKTMEERADVVNAALHDQINLLAEQTGPGEKLPLATLTMRDEVLGLYNTGRIKLPGNVMLIWDDEGYKATMRQLPQGEARNRTGGNGVYYHLAYCDNQFVQWVPLKVIRDEFNKCFASGADQYALFNVGDIRELPLTIAGAMDLVWDAKPWINQSGYPQTYLREWASRFFGEPAATDVAKVYGQFYELEYNCRATSIVEAVAPYSTEMTIMRHIWYPLSAIDVVRHAGDPRILRFFANAMTIENQSPRYGKVSRELIAQDEPLWDALLENALAVQARIPENRRPFFFSNMILQIQTSRLINHWAHGIIQGMDACERGNYAAAASLFDRAGDAMAGIIPEREKASRGKWENWFRGENHMVWKANLWALKPAAHVHDARTLAEFARSAVDERETENVRHFTPQPTTLRLAGPIGTAQMSEVKVTGDKPVKQAHLFAIINGIQGLDQGAVRINGQSFKIPRFGFLRRGLIDIEIDPKNIKPGVNEIEYSFTSDLGGKVKGYVVEEQILYIQ